MGTQRFFSTDHPQFAVVSLCRSPELDVVGPCPPICTGNAREFIFTHDPPQHDQSVFKGKRDRTAIYLVLVVDRCPLRCKTDEETAIDKHGILNDFSSYKFSTRGESRFLLGGAKQCLSEIDLCGLTECDNVCVRRGVISWDCE